MKRPSREAGAATSLSQEVRAASTGCRRLLRRPTDTIAWRTFVSAAFFAALALPSRPAPAQRVVKVRLLDYRSDQPIINTYVQITFWNGKNPQDMALKKNIVFQSTGKTDRTGRVSFLVPEPIPGHINVMSIDFFLNNASVMSTAEVLRSGAVLPYPGRQKGKRPKAKAQASAEPGEILVFNKKMTAWDRIRREIPW
jgi:hypothetical protein